MSDMPYLLADGLPPGAAEVELPRADCLVEPVLGAEEGHGAREQDVQQDPRRPHVHRLPVRPPLYHLIWGLSYISNILDLNSFAASYEFCV